MKQQCRICSRVFSYCDYCAIVKDPFKNAGYCDEDCYHISTILQKYGSKVATAADTVKDLKKHNIDNMSLRPEIDACYRAVLSELKPKRRAKIIEEIIPQEDVEVVINKDEDMTIS